MRKPSSIRTLPLTACLATLVALAWPPLPARGAEPLKSKLGFTAEAVAPAQAAEGRADTAIKKDGKEVAKVPFARPVSFSPDGRILLLLETGDDDCKHFLLNLAAGEFTKEGKRTRWVIGGRYVKKAEWSADSKTITLTSDPALSDKPVETVKVADYCREAPKLPK